ncbi:MAG TPA: HAD family hydrolase [Candidatus Heimdallarchaeota archaeon]|nr:HAD family hydrolase [Candidatus Heimdallarchaeota archaeon]
MKRRAVFLDRDGTLNKDVGYPNSFEAIEVYPYSYEAVRRINSAGFLAVVMTNQSGIGRGLIEEKKVGDIHQRMLDLFFKNNARLDGFYYCPHFINSVNPKYRKDCACRKPNPGMALKAAEDLNILLKESYMVGDKMEDIEFGLNFDATPVLLLTGHGRKALRKLSEKGLQPAYVAKDLLEAIDWILENERKSSSSK